MNQYFKQFKIPANQLLVVPFSVTFSVQLTKCTFLFFGGEIQLFSDTSGFLTKITCSSFNSPAGGYRVIVLTLIIGVEEPFEPLEEFKVVLETSFHQFVDWNNLKTRSMLYKRLYFDVINFLKFCFIFYKLEGFKVVLGTFIHQSVD